MVATDRIAAAAQTFGFVHTHVAYMYLSPYARTSHNRPIADSLYF